jgi:hypothetical protein
VNYPIQALLQKPSELKALIINLSGEALIINLSGEALIINLSGEALIINLSEEALVINLSENSIIRSSVIIFIHTNFLYIFRDCTCGGNNKRVLT